MKITKVSYEIGLKINLGGYNMGNVGIVLEAALDEGEKANDVIPKLGIAARKHLDNELMILSNEVKKHE